MTTVPIELRVNGEFYRIDVKPHWSLLYLIREKLELTGTKKGLW